MVLLLRVVSNILVLDRRQFYTISLIRSHTHAQAHAKWKSVVQSIHSCNRIEIDYTVSARAVSIYSFSIEMAFKLTALPQRNKTRKKTQIPKPTCIFIIVSNDELFFFHKKTLTNGIDRSANWANERKNKLCHLENVRGQLDVRKHKGDNECKYAVQSVSHVAKYFACCRRRRRWRRWCC